MALGTKARLNDATRIDHVYDADGTYDGTATAMDIDMQGFDSCLVTLYGTSVTADGSNFVSGFKITSNSESDGSGTDTDIAETTTTEGGTTIVLAAADYGTAVNTAVNSQALHLDIRADQMPQDDRYIAAVVAATGTYPIHIVYQRYNADHSFKDMYQATRTAFQNDGAL